MEATRIERPGVKTPGPEETVVGRAPRTQPPEPAKRMPIPEQTVMYRAPGNPPPEPAKRTPILEETVAGRTPLPAPARKPASPVPMKPPVLVPLPLERIALVALVFGRERAEALLDGLREPEARQAKNHLAGFAALSSARRQARVAVDFGVRPDAAARLRAVMEEAPEVLRRELFRRLPPYHRSLFPERQVEPPDAAATPAVCALAERLLREATR